jgi:hypothetical protein
MKNVLMVSVLGAAMALAGCGDKDEDKGTKDDPSAAEGGGEAAKGGGEAAAGPTLDCAAFTAKMNECIETFAPIYAKTSSGSRSGKDMEGNVDHDKAAKNFKMLWGMSGEELCVGPNAGGDTPFVKRDPRWKERFQGCADKASCDEWAPCMASAMGDPLPAP